MSKASDAANAVVNAIDQVCGLYGVEVLRMQSRTIMVEGAAGRVRPLFIGRWRDQFGNWHNSGMADVLARPRVRAGLILKSHVDDALELITVPLWIEAKSGKGALTPDQRAFKSYVESNREAHLVIHDDVTPLMDWFKAHGVEKQAPETLVSSNAILAAVRTESADQFPCRHCKLPKAEHLGPAFGCPGARRTVWSPKVSAKAPALEQNPLENPQYRKALDAVMGRVSRGGHSL